MASQDINDAIVKAASAGFAQGLLKRGYTPEMAKQATYLYAHPERGLLVKRAYNKCGRFEKIASDVFQAVSNVKAALIQRLYS